MLALVALIRAEPSGLHYSAALVWQTIEYPASIAHTHGVLAILRHLPRPSYRLWPSKVDNGVDAMLSRRFPKVAIVRGTEALQAAFAECDFLLHGSGPSLVAQNDVARWSKETGKPYGIYGITLGAKDYSSTPTPDAKIVATIQVLNGARFAFFRDSVSLQHARDRGCTCPIMEFGPDGAFATDLRDDAKAEAFLEANGLERGKFLCCIPRLRYTPYWKMKPGVAFDETKHAQRAMKGHDLAPCAQRSPWCARRR